DPVRVDSGELHDHGDRRRIVGAVDIEGRSKAGAPCDESRYLAEVGEELFHLRLHAVDLPACSHETIVPMGRILKASALGLGFLAYVWVAGVRNAEGVKSRKRARRAARLVSANEREEAEVERWTRAMIRYRWWVAGIWAVLFLLGGYATSGLSALLTNRFTLPGTDTARADSILEDHFGQKTVGSFSVVVKGAPGSAEQLLPIVRERAAAAAKELPTGQLAGVQAVSDSVVSATIVSNLEPADAKGHTDDMRAAAGEIPGATVYVSGQAAIEHDLDPVFAHDLQVGELFIAIPIAALILAFVFGTLAFLLPLIFAAAAIPTTLAIIWLFAHVMELTTYLQNLVMLIGFGIAIDYSLLVVHRYREELRTGKSKEDAIVRTMETAGRAVVFSGSAVGIGLA